MKGVDLFAGAGGTSTGAIMSGVDIVWAANHNPIAVEYHKINHPSAHHVCQDLHQADWSQVPKHDIVFGSPCCQGHSRAAGKAKETIKADLSRSTAWAIVSCLEAHKSPVAIIENVTDFLNWTLYDAWEFAMKKLGYSLSINFMNAADMGVPQNRLRLIIVATRSKNPIELNIEKEAHIPASTFVDMTIGDHKWDLVSDRVKATQDRVKNGRERYGDIFLDAAYGSEVGGRSIHKPIGTITTVNKHSVVIGDRIRSLTLKEIAAAQSFPVNYKFPKSSVMTKSLIGNAVPPLMAKKYTQAVMSLV